MCNPCSTLSPRARCDCVMPASAIPAKCTSSADDGSAFEARFYVRNNDGGEQNHLRAADDRPPMDVGDDLAAALLRLAGRTVPRRGGTVLVVLLRMLRRHAIVGHRHADHGRRHLLRLDLGPGAVVVARLEPVAVVETVVTTAVDEHVVGASRDVLNR